MKPGRMLIAVVLIVALAASAATRQWAQHDRNQAIYGPRGPSYAAGSSVGRMNSFALALLLGGLRGPLVMFLWMNSESQKNEHNLEGVETQIEWIRLLQPEFDTVHLFQIWNKAYNLSVQMASLSNKYLTILGALDYAHSVDRQRPNDINIVAAIAQVYFDKLGGSAEKDYYRPRVRQETLPHTDPQKLRQGDHGWRRLELDPMLDAKGDILPQYLETTRPPPSDLKPGEEWNTGAELQYLKEYQPFPYGLSPLALAYNYYKRAQVMQDHGQRHIQLSDLVIDSRPALSLKGWAEAEWGRGRRFELEAFGKTIPSERLDMETQDAALPPDAKVDNSQAMEGAMWSYDRTVRLCRDAQKEYWRHLDKYKINLFTYLAHIDHLEMMDHLVSGDIDYLKAVTAPSQEKAKLLKEAAARYQQAIYKNQQIILKHYVDEDILIKSLPKGHDKSDLNDDKPNHIPFTAYAGILDHVDQLERQAAHPDMHQDDRHEYETYLKRAQTRFELCR
jgi:hypothetical protein